MLTAQQDQARKKAIEQALTLGQPLPTTAPTPAAPQPTVPALFPSPNATGTAQPSQPPTPVKPISMSTPGYGAPASDPEQSYLQNHPMAGGTPPTPFAPETTRHALLRGLFAGMSEFGRPGAGFAQNEQWNKQQQEKEDATRNWPMQREANIKNAMNIDLQREKTEAEIGVDKANIESAKRNYPTQQQMYGKWLSDAGDDEGKRRVAVDMIARAETAAHPESLDPFRLYVAQFAVQHPGQIPTFDQWQEEQAKGAKQGTLKPEIIAQVGPEPDPRTYPQGNNDPEYQKAAVKWGADYQAKLQAENEATAIARGQAYGQYRPVQVIDPADGKEKTMWAKDAVAAGASGAAQGIPLQAKEAQIGDIEFASQQAREAIQNLPPLDAGSIATLTMAMRETDPTVFAKLKDTLLGSQQLNPQQKAFMTWMLQLNERAMSLRSIAGMGQAGEDLRGAIQATLPGIKSGNKDLMLQQLDAFDNQVRILKTGIPGINHPAAPQVRPAGVPPEAVWNPTVKRWQLPQPANK